MHIRVFLYNIPLQILYQIFVMAAGLKLLLISFFLLKWNTFMKRNIESLKQYPHVLFLRFSCNFLNEGYGTLC